MMKDKTTANGRALRLVRSSLASMGEERSALQGECDLLKERLRDCINRPLSKAAMIELCGRIVDRNAAAYLAKFAALVGPECLRVEAAAISTKRPLVLSDVAIIMGRDHEQPAPDGGFMSGYGQTIHSWWVNPLFDSCYFFGDVIKAKLVELWSSVQLPHEDDGKSLVEREEEAQALREQLAEADARLAALDVDLAEISEAAKVVPPAGPTPQPIVPDENGLYWDPRRGFQRVQETPFTVPSESAGES